MVQGNELMGGAGWGGTINETHMCSQCTPTAGLRVQWQNNCEVAVESVDGPITLRE